MLDEIPNFRPFTGLDRKNGSRESNRLLIFHVLKSFLTGFKPFYSPSVRVCVALSAVVCLLRCPLRLSVDQHFITSSIFILWTPVSASPRIFIIDDDLSEKDHAISNVFASVSRVDRWCIWMVVYFVLCRSERNDCCSDNETIESRYQKDLLHETQLSSHEKSKDWMLCILTKPLIHIMQCKVLSVK